MCNWNNLNKNYTVHSYIPISSQKKNQPKFGLPERQQGHLVETKQWIFFMSSPNAAIYQQDLIQNLLPKGFFKI